MPDRRQGDRRQGIENKHIKISLLSFIYIVIIIVIIIMFTILCIILSKINYTKGYESGLIEGSSKNFEQLYDYDNYMPDVDDLNTRNIVQIYD